MTNRRSSSKSRSHLKRNVIAASLIIAALVGGYFFTQKAKVNVDALLLRAQHQYEAGELRVIVKSGVQENESGGGLVDRCHLDPIFEFDPNHQLRQVIETA